MCSELAGRAREQAEQHGLTVAPEERCLGLGVVAARLVRGRASRVGARDGARVGAGVRVRVRVRVGVRVRVRVRVRVAVRVRVRVRV